MVSLGLFFSVRMFEGDSSSYMLYDGMLEEALELTAEVLMQMEELTKTIHINKDRMYENAWKNRGLDNSEFVMMNMAAKIGKDNAYELMYEKAMKVELGGSDYLSVLLEDEYLTKIFTRKELESMIWPENYVGCGAKLAEIMAEKATNKAKKLMEEK